jgi:hypothetical protein
VSQPFSSFGGVVAEALTGSDWRLSRRAAERLRHKNRCVTPWDYERLVLETLPAVHRVKCISHSREGAWLAPGHVLLVVVPDLRHLQPRDPLQPRIDADTVSEIQAFVQRRMGMQVQVHVRNPRYQAVHVDFAVRFRPGHEYNYYSAQLKQRLKQYLAPWAFASDRPPAFGGQFYRSELLALVEAEPSVDYVTDFSMSFSNGADLGPDLSEARPETPDAILTSAESHGVRAVTP